MVDSRWAMTIACAPRGRAARARWISTSFSESRWLVASSRMTIAGSLSSTRAIARRCFSPPDSGSPARRRPCRTPRAGRRSRRGSGRPGRPRPAPRRWRRAWRTAGSPAIDSWNRWGSWVTMPIAPAQRRRVRSRTSWPSMRMAPWSRRRGGGSSESGWSCRRRTARPAPPVWPGWAVKDTPRRTRPTGRLDGHRRSASSDAIETSAARG